MLDYIQYIIVDIMTLMPTFFYHVLSMYISFTDSTLN